MTVSEDMTDESKATIRAAWITAIASILVAAVGIPIAYLSQRNSVQEAKESAEIAREQVVHLKHEIQLNSAQAKEAVAESSDSQSALDRQTKLLELERAGSQELRKERDRLIQQLTTERLESDDTITELREERDRLQEQFSGTAPRVLQSGPPWQIATVNQALLGRSRAEIKKLLGEPDHTTGVGSRTEVWKYQSARRLILDEVTQKYFSLKITFREDKVYNASKTSTMR